MMVYLAGRMTGLPDLNRAAFADAADALRERGYSVYNPAASNLEGLPLSKIMSHVLTQLCEADAIAMLPGWWTRFGGAWVEYILARYLKKKIVKL